MAALSAVVFALSWWLGLYLLARDPRKPMLAWSAFGLCSFAVVVAVDAIRLAGDAPRSGCPGLVRRSHHGLDRRRHHVGHPDHPDHAEFRSVLHDPALDRPDVYWFGFYAEPSPGIELSNRSLPGAVPSKGEARQAASRA